MLATDRNQVDEGGAFSTIYSIARWWDAERSGGVSKGEIRVVAIGGIVPDKFDIERPNQVQLLSRHLITREDDIVVENIKPQQVY